MSRKLKVKVVRAEGQVVTLSIDGEHHSYLIGRPQPLGAQDVHFLRRFLDTSYFDSLARAVAQPRWAPVELLQHFVARCRKTEPVQFSLGGPVIVDYIRKNAVPLDVEGTACFVLTPENLKRIERGKLG